MSDAADRIIASTRLNLWVDALRQNLNDDCVLSDVGMQDISNEMASAARLLVEADKLIKASRATFYNPENLPENVVRLRK